VRIRASCCSPSPSPQRGMTSGDMHACACMHECTHQSAQAHAAMHERAHICMQHAPALLTRTHSHAPHARNALTAIHSGSGGSARAGRRGDGGESDSSC
jgi:hypothetical protein